MDRYPLFFEPVFVEKIWGDGNLARIFPRKGLPRGTDVGESWEIAAHADHTTRVSNGPAAGRTLADLAAETPDEVAGPRAMEAGGGRFPLLVKFLDAFRRLSVQVHPDDAYAAEHEGDLGKMEAWYVVEAKEDAFVCKGLKPGCGRDDFERLLEEERVEECLNMFRVSAGDVIFIPPRTLHTLGGGVVVYEIQQSSNVTYRAYDWGRVDREGNKRPLHVEQVFEVADFAPPARTVEPIRRPETAEYVIPLVRCAAFILEEVRAESPFSMAVPDDRFLAVTVMKGAVRLRWGSEEASCGAGTSMLLPPGMEAAVAPEEPLLMLVGYVPPAAVWFRR